MTSTTPATDDPRRRYRVIAVDVRSPLLDREALSSMFGVLLQTVSLLGQREAAEQATAADLLLRPELAEVGPADFDRCLHLAAAEEWAARARAEELAEWSLPAADWSS